MAKRKKKMKKESMPRRLVKLLGVCCLLIGIVVSFILVWNVTTMVIDAYSFDITKYKTDVASMIYAVDKNGDSEEYEQIHSSTNRLWVTINKIPLYAQRAAVAIEDERFYTHQGMDIKRTAGAVLGFVTGMSDYGGSTITQQLIKNVTGEWEDTPVRKMKEILRALVLETQMDKDEILEYYLNVVYFGNGSYGLQMAAHTYFDKDASELSLAEAAAIIGITQSPKTFDPFVNKEKNKEKQEVVLYKMLQLGYITQEEHDAAVNEKLNFIEGSNEDNTSVNSYFTETLIEELSKDLANNEKISLEQAKQRVYTGGLKIYATVRTDVQSAAEKVFEDTSNRTFFPRLSGEVQPEAAMAVLDPKTGAIIGIVGGKGKKEANLILNRAVKSYRQPGSSIKPIAAYGPAVELNLLTPSSIIVDEPFEYNGWKPQNWYRGFKGNVTMRQAVTQSMNIPAIKTVLSVGIETSFDFAKNKLGLKSLDDVNDKNLSPLSLGGLTKGVSVLDLTAAYGAFANKGVYTEPYTYTKVADRYGNTVIEKDIKSRRVFSEETASIMTSVLKSTAEGPLGVSAKLSGGMPSAGKTGTTNDDKDRWYIGYTPYYLGGVWYGYDQPKTVPYAATRIVAHKIWQAVMNDIHSGLEVKKLDEGGNVVYVNVCTQTGKLPSASCTVTKEIFKKGHTPTAYCKGHAVKTEESDENASPKPSETPGEPAGTEQPSAAPTAETHATPSGDSEE